MIEGDIDLTTNLDFYHDKPKQKELPSIIPWKNNEYKTVINNGFYSFNYDPDILSSRTVSYTTFNNSSYNDILDEMIISSSLSYSYETLYNTVTYSANINNNYTNDCSYIVDCNNKRMYISSIDTSNIDTTKNLFGYSSKPEYYKVSSSFNKCYKCGSYHIGKYCNCEKYDSDKYYRCKKQIGKNKIIPNHKYSFCFKKIIGMYSYFLGGGYKRFAYNHKIPWLSNLQSNEYDDYITDLNEEQDYTEYLTNMRWLGIH